MRIVSYEADGRRVCAGSAIRRRSMDVIATGTPPGVGFARKPPVWLVPGDTVQVEIEGIGVLENPVVSRVR